MSDKIDCTLEDHVKRLLYILEFGNPCECCPSPGPIGYEINDEIHAKCNICRSFVRVTTFANDGMLCPCKVLGHKESIKRTWLALEEGGWL